jgi:hypothetical protein
VELTTVKREGFQTPIAWATNLLEEQRVEEPDHVVVSQ